MKYARAVCVFTILLLSGSLLRVHAQQSEPAAWSNARVSPEFLKRASIYQIWLKSFTTEGTLRAAMERLPYVKELGATIVYLSPVQLQSSDCTTSLSPRTKQSKAGGCANPYRIKDYDRIDPEYGTEADLKAFIDKAHQLGLKVLMDQVYLHAGPDTVLFNRPNFILRGPDNKVVFSRWNFPQLNFDNPALRQYLIGNLLHWTKDLHADGFRLDVAGAVPLDFWEDARDALERVNPDIVMLAESDEVRSQIKAFDINYNFPYYDALLAVIRDGEPASRIREQWEAARAMYPSGARLLHLSDNHDRDRADAVFSGKGALATAVLNFTLDGIPFVYNGQEIGDCTPNDILSHASIRWDVAEFPQYAPRLQLFKRLFQMRSEESALSSGELFWIRNTAPASVITFLRKHGDQEILVAINLTNQKCPVSITLTDTGWNEPVSLRKLVGVLAEFRTERGERALRYTGAPEAANAHPSRIDVYPATGVLSIQLGAFDYVVAKRMLNSRPTGANRRTAP